MWCGGARETREQRVTIEWLLSKWNIFSIVPAFLDLDGIPTWLYRVPPLTLLIFFLISKILDGMTGLKVRLSWLEMTMISFFRGFTRTFLESSILSLEIFPLKFWIFLFYHHQCTWFWFHFDKRRFSAPFWGTAGWYYHIFYEDNFESEFWNSPEAGRSIILPQLLWSFHYKKVASPVFSLFRWPSLDFQNFRLKIDFPSMRNFFGIAAYLWF